MSTSVKASTSSLILYSAQFVVQTEAYLPGTSLVKRPLLVSVHGNICHACSYTSLICIIINKYKIAYSKERIVVILLSLHFLIIRVHKFISTQVTYIFAIKSLFTISVNLHFTSLIILHISVQWHNWQQLVQCLWVLIPINIKLKGICSQKVIEGA